MKHSIGETGVSKAHFKLILFYIVSFVDNKKATVLTRMPICGFEPLVIKRYHRPLVPPEVLLSPSVFVEGYQGTCFGVSKSYDEFQGDITRPA